MCSKSIRTYLKGSHFILYHIIMYSKDMAQLIVCRYIIMFDVIVITWIRNDITRDLRISFYENILSDINCSIQLGYHR